MKRNTLYTLSPSSLYLEVNRRSNFVSLYLIYSLNVSFLLVLRWTVRDIGIWMADEIAKIEGSEVTAGFVNRISKDSSSNNNKLAVRPVEKVAKFPKKEALKSPKKTGVKKKNYYNTKLSFSKDPRNPNAIAIATATAALGAEIIGTDTDAGSDSDNDISGDTVEALETAVSLSLDEIESGTGYESDGSSIAVEASEEDSDDVTSSGDEEVRAEETGDEMEDVDVLQLTERSEELSPAADEAPTMMPVAVIAAVDMIRFSTLLMP